MRTLLFLILFSTRAWAQTVYDIQADQPWKLLFDHTANYQQQIWLNGVRLTNFTVSQITVVTNNGTNFTFSVNMPPLDRGGVYVVTATSQIQGTNTDGTPILIESDQSQPLRLRAKPRAPWWLRLF
jgi:hypothetical protein